MEGEGKGGSTVCYLHQLAAEPLIHLHSAT